MNGTDIGLIIGGVPTVTAAIVAIIMAFKANNKSNAAVAAVKIPDVKAGD